MKKETIRILNMYRLKCYSIEAAQEELLVLYDVSKRFSIRSFTIGIGCGIALGLMLALIIINVC